MKMTAITKMLWLPILSALGAITWIWLQRDTSPPSAVLGKELLAQGVHEFALSPDGEQIIYCDAKGVKRLFLKTGRKEVLQQFSSQTVRYPVRSIAWSPDMSFVALIRGDAAGGTEITVIHLPTKRSAVIARAKRFWGIAWSPDGEQLAWLKDESETVPTLARLKQIFSQVPSQKESKAGNNARGKTHSFNLRWTPDGRYLVIGHTKELYLVRPDSSEQKRVRPPGPSPKHPAFVIYGWDIAPDSSTLAFGFDHKIWIYSLGNTEHPALTIPLEGIPIGICWSPSGKELLYVVPAPAEHVLPPGAANVGPPHILHRVDRNGEGDKVILRERNGIYAMQWTKGREVFYLSGSPTIPQTGNQEVSQGFELWRLTLWGE